MSYTLEIRHADGRVETREFEQPSLVLGRDAVDLQLDDARLSGRHAELRFDGMDLLFRDLASTNGSFDQAGERLREPLHLQPDQAVRVGDTTLTLRSLAAAGLAVQERPTQPRLTLHLRELRCISQQELDGDEPYLFVRKNKVWSCERMKTGVTVLLGSVPPTDFTEEIDVALMERDIFEDDRLGSGTATIDDLGRGVLNFDWTEARCHYQLLYEVTLAEPARVTVDVTPGEPIQTAEPVQLAAAEPVQITVAVPAGVARDEPAEGAAEPAPATEPAAPVEPTPATEPATPAEPDRS